jgi:hypothetical protein
VRGGILRRIKCFQLAKQSFEILSLWEGIFFGHRLDILVGLA